MDLSKMSVEDMLREVENNGSNVGDGRGDFDPHLIYRAIADITRRIDEANKRAERAEAQLAAAIKEKPNAKE